MNAITVIAPYKHHGMWVFDDPREGLVQEPFMAGADTMIDRVVADIPDAEHGFTLIFSSTPFPGHQYCLDGRRAEGGGAASALIFPWQLIKRRLVATSAVAIFWHVEFLMLVVFDAGTMLIAPAVSFSINPMRFHNRRI